MDAAVQTGPNMSELKSLVEANPHDPDLRASWKRVTKNLTVRTAETLGAIVGRGMSISSALKAAVKMDKYHQTDGHQKVFNMWFISCDFDGLAGYLSESRKIDMIMTSC